MRPFADTIYFHATTLAVCFILAGLSPVHAQQRPQYTQYMFNGLVLNPGFAGTDEALSLTFVNRSQWSGIKGAPLTQTLSAHTLFGRKKLGVGIFLMNDKIGVHKNQLATAAAAYHLPVSEKGILSMGLQGGVSIRRSDYASLNSGSTPDPRVSNTDFSRTLFNLGAGFYYRSTRLHAGISAPGLIPENFNVNDTVTISWNNSQYFMFARYRMRLNSSLDLEPGFLLKYQQHVPLSYDVNASLVVKKVLWLGFSYRKEESVAFLLKAQMTPQLQLGYSYDMVIGDVSRSSTGSHELLVNYVFNYSNKKIASPR